MKEFKGFDKHLLLNNARKKARARKMYSKEYIKSQMSRMFKEALMQSPLREVEELTVSTNLEAIDQE